MEELKKMAAEKAVEYVEDGMVLGLGTGSTTRYAIEKIGELVKEGMHVFGIPTSIETEKLASEMGIPLSILEECRIDLTIDGADEVDPNLNLIKGRGGALVREKIVANNSKREIIVVDELKVTEILSSSLPVEIVKFGWRATRRAIQRMGGTPTLREGKDGPFLTDNGNYILDCEFGKIENPEKLSRDINSIPGVVENGLFINMVDEVIIGTREGIKIKRNNRKSIE